jgi:translocation and assembly module TamB
VIRRRTIIALSAAGLLALGVSLVGGAIAFTRTAFGRERIRAVVLAELRRAIHGRVYIGRLSGNFLTTVVIDSLEIRDLDGFLFVAAGRVTATYDPRDIFARKIALRDVALEHPVLQLIRHRSGIWNLMRLFPPARPLVPLDRLPTPVRQLPQEATRGFGDYIVVDTVTVHDGTVSYSMPWDPADTVRRAQRDSEITSARHDPRQGVSWWAEGLMRTLHWDHVDFASPHVRIVDPDSAGVAFGITRFDADESDPPFRFRAVRGRVRIVGDSAFLDLPHLELPGSIASGGGKLWWGQSSPLSASLHFVADSISLADIAWVYPTLPRTGGGHGVFDMQSDRDPHITAYALSGLDVRTTDSHIHGAITFVVGRPTLAIRDVALRVDPLDMAFIRTLTGTPFPVDWAGQFTGFARGPGGPVSRFRVDTTDLFYRDAHVPGAISHAAGSGELDVTDPSETIFHHFRLTLHQLDLRTPEFVLPKFASLHGTISGTATLDSVWDDITIRGADIVHHDGDGAETRLLGGGHITLGDPATTYDLDLRADPLALGTIAQSYPNLWLRGSVAGPLTLHGTLDDLDVTAALTSDAGTIRIQGHANTQGPLYSARGTLALNDADLRALTGRPSAPTGPLTARATLDLEGDSIGDLAGSAAAQLERSIVDGFRVVAAQATLRFAGGRMIVDSIDADWALGSLRASGGLGLVPSVSDSLLVTGALDSLGGLRRFLAAAPTQRDSLTGTLRLAATLSGSLDSLGATGTVVGGDMRVGGARIRSVGASFALANVPVDPRGTSALNLDGLSLWGVALDHLGVTAQLEGGGRTLVGLGVAAPVADAAAGGSGPRGAAALEIVRSPGATVVAVDTFALYTGTNAWHLTERSARVRIDTAGFTLDPMTLRGSESGWIAVRATVPVAGSSLVHVVADSIRLADIGTLVESPVRVAGLASLDWTITGPRAAPIMRLEAALEHLAFGDARLDGISVTGGYADRRADLSTDVLHGRDTTLHAGVSVPVDLALTSVPERVMVDGPIHGNIHADSTDFGALATLYPTLQDPKGALRANVDVAGTIRHPTFTGEVHIANAEAGFPQLGVRLLGITADLGLAGDSVAIRTLSAATLTADRHGQAVVDGWLTFVDPTDPHFGLTLHASDFHVLHHSRLADIEVSTTTPLRLMGSENASRLTGAVRVDRGTIYLRDVLQKQVINLDDPDIYTIIDTSIVENQHLLPQPPPRFVQGLRIDTVQVTLAQDVWLKSSEATINLATSEGPLYVTTAPTGQDSTRALALSGVLVAARGDYRLNLGIVQRTFIVDQPGTVRFSGDPGFNPALDITAIHTVRQPQVITGDVKPDVRIRVALRGTLERPTVVLSSADAAQPSSPADTSRLQQYSQSDLLSYLVTGHPSYDVTSGGNAAVLTSVVLPTLGTALGSQLSGGLFDYVQVQPGGYSQIGPQAGTAQGALFNTLSGTRIGAGKQIGARTFVSADVGVCQLGALSGGGAVTGAAGATPGFADQIGIRVEHQLTSRLSIAAASEPGTNALYCTSAYSRSFVTTPRQWGLDLFHTWQF